MREKVIKMVKVFYTDGGTYIDDLVFEDRSIFASEMGILEAIMLSIKLDCDFDMDYSDERYENYAKKEALSIFKWDYIPIDEDKDFGKLLLKVKDLFNVVIE